VIDLVEQGVITCGRKTFHPGKIVAGFLFGTQRLYEFVNNNPLIEMHPTDYVNDPFNISQNARMVAINSALQIDLTGQVCADSVGAKMYSGAGGQVDFIRGAARSKGGLPIIACLSTARDGAVSRIVPTLYEGSGVVTTRNDVHWVVTEFGIASLHGKTLRQRAQSLIRIAHPKFRDELTCAAKKMGYL
jgi:acetyl-CoA hydrolase